VAWSRQTGETRWRKLLETANEIDEMGERCSKLGQPAEGGHTSSQYEGTAEGQLDRESEKAQLGE